MNLHTFEKNYIAPYCFAKSRGKKNATGSTQALKGFLGIKKARAEDPGSPEKLFEAGYQMYFSASVRS